MLGGPCDIETLVSLLSSGGSDSEKEDSAPSPPTDTDSFAYNNLNNNLIGSKRPPMLKKAGKSGKRLTQKEGGHTFKRFGSFRSFVPRVRAEAANRRAQPGLLPGGAPEASGVATHCQPHQEEPAAGQLAERVSSEGC